MTAPEVHIGRCQVGDAFVLAQMTMGADEVSDLLFEITWQIIIFQQDAVFKGLVPPLEDSFKALGVDKIQLLHLHDPEWALSLDDITKPNGVIAELFRMKCLRH